MNLSFFKEIENKRYRTWNHHLKEKFGCKVFKVSLNGGFTCPNIDGTKGTGGCIYCSSKGSGDFAGNPQKSLQQQFHEVKGKLHQKWPQAKYIPYFQANTNTYAPVSVLREKYETVLGFPNVVGLSIATRPDALEDDVLDYLAELSQRTYLIVELGLQTIFDATGERINRCHTYAEFLEGFRRLQARGIHVCVHIINGLPGETREMMLQSVRALSSLNLHAIKIHLLHILKGTTLADQYSHEKFSLLELEEYTSIVCDQLELLSPHVIIQRLTGDGEKKNVIGPLWSLKKFVVLNEIDKEFKRRGTHQGYYYQIKT